MALFRLYNGYDRFAAGRADGTEIEIEGNEIFETDEPADIATLRAASASVIECDEKGKAVVDPPEDLAGQILAQAAAALRSRQVN